MNARLVLAFGLLGIALNAQTSPPTAPEMAGNYGKLPLSFEANQGQIDPQVKYLSRGDGYSLFLTDTEAVLTLTRGDPWASKIGFLPRSGEPGKPGEDTVKISRSAKSDVVRMELSGARHDLKVAGADRLPGTTNYFIGKDPAKWRSNVATYAKVKYASVYPGIDLVYYGNQRQLEYDFVVAPNADPRPIRLHFNGAKKLRLDADGDLQIIAAHGQVAFHKPAVYQTINGSRRSVIGRFRLMADNTARFALGNYDHSRPLIVDPVLVYSTYLGGSIADQAKAIAVDNAGNAYVTGVAYSMDFPVTAGAFQSTAAMNGVAFVSKINPAGTALLYSTFLGASYGGSGIAVDSSGDAYVTGGTGASDFPVTPGAFQTTNLGVSFSGYNAFITKLNPTGTALLYSTFLGGGASGHGGDEGRAIAVDGSGNAFVTGSASSSDFPVTAGALQTSINVVCSGVPNAFVTEINPTGSALLYSTYLGGSGQQFGSGFSAGCEGDSGTAIAVDRAGHAYVTGSVSSSNFPVTAGAFQRVNHATYPTNFNAFISKVSPDGTALLYSTYLGGSCPNQESDFGLGIAVDSAGEAYVTGSAASTDFPVTTGAFQTVNHSAGTNAFVTKLNSLGTGLVYSTYLGGSSSYLNSTTIYVISDAGTAIAVDGLGSAYVTGPTDSSDFPVTAGALQSTNKALGNKQPNAFVTRLNSTGTALLYSTYLGGSGNPNGPLGGSGTILGGDFGAGIAVDSLGNAYVVGGAGSANFPVSAGAFQTANKGGANFITAGDAFIARLTTAPGSGANGTTTVVSSDGNPQALGVKVTFTASVAPILGSEIPTGTVSFSIDGGAGTAVALDSLGKAVYSISTLAMGAHAVTANYAGDANYSASSNTLTETILPLIGTTTTLSSSANPAVVGTLFTATVFVQPVLGSGVPTGSITGVLDGVSIGSLPLDSTGSTSLTDSTLSVGTHTLQVSYSGDATYSTSSATLTEIISAVPIGYQFIPVTPCRVADTRGGAGPFGGPGLGAGTTRTFDIPQSSCGIPASAVAYSLNVTVVPNATLNYLTMWPAGLTQPYVSTLNSDGRIKANAAITPAGTNGGVSVFVSDATDVILDIDGYFVSAGAASALSFYPVTPCRVSDTRSGAGPLGGPFITGNTHRDFPVQSSSCGIPASAQAYSLNVTAIPHTTLNYLTAWATGQTQPVVSTLNSFTGAVVANAAIVPAASNGDVAIFVSDDADVILDVNGYFAAPGGSGLSLYTTTPCRIVDTRSVGGAFNGVLSVGAQASTCAPPGAALAYVLNATVVPSGPLNYLTLWPAGQTQPYVSTLNAIDGAITSNMAIVPNVNGSVDVFSSNRTNVILDISSYFAP